MNKLFVILISILSLSCRGAGVANVAEIPVFAECEQLAIIKAREFKNDGISVRYVEFAESNSMSPFYGYLKIYSQKPKSEVQPFINAISSICSYEGYSTISRDDLQYRVLNQDLISAIKSGKKEILIEVKSDSINVYR